MKRSRLTRRTPLKRGTKRMKRSRLNPVGKKAKRQKLRARQFAQQAERCRNAPCCACGSPPPSEPHHVIPRSRGGLDEHTVPLCVSCHRRGHSIGWATFGRIFGVNLVEVAAKMQEGSG